MATNAQRRLAVTLCVACVVLGFAPQVLSQEVIITQYTDTDTVDEETLYFYVEAFDQSDTQGATHYDYQTSVNVWGTGSDSDGGPGLGPWWLDVPVTEIDDDSYWSVESIVWFICTGMGPLGGVAPADIVAIKVSHYRYPSGPTGGFCLYYASYCAPGTHNTCGTNYPHPIVTLKGACKEKAASRFAYFLGACRAVGAAWEVFMPGKCT